MRTEAPYEELRPLMFSIAYRMVGSVSEAEDIVQEAFLRFHRESQRGARIDSPKAYLSSITTRLGIDHLRSARVRRETYVGQWLPEPLLTETEPDAALVAYGDTGGRGPSLPRPIHGRDKVSRILPEFARVAKEAGLRMELAEVNGQPGCVWVDQEGRLGAVVSIDIADDQVQAIRS